ncbi:MAG: PepSY-like domain-containing protein [Cytophagaceae bacterium]
MKRLILFVALIFAGYVASAQDVGFGQGQSAGEEVNKEVKSSFTDKFPGVNMEEVEWGNEADYHKAEFSMQEKEYTAVFDQEGKWISTETKNIPLDEVPKEVRDGFQETAYSDYNVNEIEKIESEDVTLYKMELRSGLRGTDLYLSEQGNIVRIDS